MTQLLAATRNRGKFREIKDILDGLGLEVVDPDQAGVGYEPAEEELERYETFRENALAKVRYFAGRTGLPAVADDSGLVVDALGGEPGVRSKRFSSRGGLSGEQLGLANNQALLGLLTGVPDPDRTASFVCVAALVLPDGRERLFEGRLEGIITREPRGDGGFGYDPLFFVPAEGATTAELSPARKNAISHRGRAFRALRAALEAGGRG
ncbi:MAG: RdgB/HAM1 family non-canonical purine NTP pyrophosphatase [Longimicrobiaceae bacterium]